MKTIIALTIGLAAAVAPFTEASAAVLITTGTTPDGRAFITLPTMTFTIVHSVSASGFSSLEFDIVNAWSTIGTIPALSAAGSGLTFTDSAYVGTMPLTNWIGHASTFDSSSDYDSALITPANTSYIYTAGDVITLTGGTFTLSTGNAAFPVFSTGSYSIYFGALGAGGGILSTEGVAVPEPSCVMLLLIGVATCFVYRRARSVVVAPVTVVVAVLSLSLGTIHASAPGDAASKLIPVWSYDSGNSTYTCATGSITSIGFTTYKLRKAEKMYLVAEMIVETVAGPSVRIFCEKEDNEANVKNFVNLAAITPVSDLTKLQTQADQAAAEADRLGSIRRGESQPTAVTTLQPDASGNSDDDVRTESQVTKAKTEIKVASPQEVLTAAKSARTVWLSAE